jgi:hypothetical protein
MRGERLAWGGAGEKKRRGRGGGGKSARFVNRSREEETSFSTL